MKAKFYSSIRPLKFSIILATLITPLVSQADPSIEHLHGGGVNATAITYPNGTRYFTLTSSGDPGSSVDTRGKKNGGKWIDCGKNKKSDDECKEALEEAVDDAEDSGGGNTSGGGENTGGNTSGGNTSGGNTSGGNTSSSSSGGATAQSGSAPSSPIRNMRTLNVNALKRLPGRKKISTMSKADFMRKYGK